jgi:23S rRNA (adenine2503-C2)-methyltransferase
MSAGRKSVFEEEELSQWLAARGEPRFRTAQIRQAIVDRRATSFEPMTDLPKRLRDALADEWTILSSQVVTASVAEDGTTKFLLALADAQTIECVLIPEEARRTVCLSTQVGCAMACVFCASGLAGVVRNLSTVEMIEELLWCQSRLPTDERINHIVVMGMGEPLANLESLLPALDFATDAKSGLGLSARNVTISTVGLPAKIRRLAQVGKPYHLAVSLHAPNDRLRQQIVPTAEKVRLGEILSAADEFRATTGRQVTFEYVLLGGVNDQVLHARELSRLLGRRDAMVNLIPYNPVSGLPYKTPLPAHSRAFADVLREAGHIVKIRKRKGSAIDAACGQLRRDRTNPVPIVMEKSAPVHGESQQP